MSDTSNFGFGRLVPGFDFLQNIAKGGSQALPQMPSLSSWVAPTLNVEELEKRISELKAVHFWLDQNSKALGATIQALEVQKMTLATLQGMNFSMGDLASALKLKTTDTVSGGVQKMAAGVQKAAEAAGSAAGTVAGAAKAAKAKASGNGKATGDGEGGGQPIDPLQWWGALTQQFQEIATNAMQDATQKTAVAAAKNLATGVAKEAVKAAKGAAGAPARKKAARRKA